MTTEMKSFLQLVYSLCKQYISWYETNIKNTVPTLNTEKNVV